MNKNKLNPHFGLSIDQSIDDFGSGHLSVMLRDHKLLLFKKQHLDDSLLEKLSKRMGRLLSSISRVSNIPELGSFGSDVLPWHTDLVHSYPVHVPGLILYAQELPSDQQTVTRFADLDWVIERLPNEFKNIKVQHMSDNRYGGWLGKDPHLANSTLIRKRNNREYLTFSPAHWIDFPELDEERKKLVFEQIANLIRDPDNVYDHYWEQGDLLIIDNERLSHHREEIISKQPRVLLRATLFYKHQVE